MKRAILFFCAVCLCFILAPRAQVQRKGPRAVTQRPPREYKAGETYSLGDVINLNTDGNKLTVQLLKSKQGAQPKSSSIEVKLMISGKVQVLGFTFGQENSAVTMIAGGKRIAASRADFTDEVVATESSAALVSRFRTSADAGTLVLDTNEHPLILGFDIPTEFTSAPKQLDLNNVSVGKAKYSLVVKLSP